MVGCPTARLNRQLVALTLTAIAGVSLAADITFIDNKLDISWKYVPIHELGHYFGLCHVDGVDRVTYSSGQISRIDSWTLPKPLYTKGDPSFTLGEAKQTWGYIVAQFSARCLGGNREPTVIR